MKSSNIGKFVHIKKLCNDQGHLQMLAIDQRPPVFSLIKEKKNISGIQFFARDKHGLLRNHLS